MGSSIVIVAIIMGASVAITYLVFDFIVKVQKNKSALEQDNGDMLRLSEELRDLKKTNSRLQKRIENLEAIVVDNDMEGLRSEFSENPNTGVETVEKEVDTSELE